jgi:NAD(P)-dependent dehydrogenase (short-subunit alcohol dehydrogenase family)
VDTQALCEKVIVVVGGTSGLGLAGAKAIARAGGRYVSVGLDDQHAGFAKEGLVGDGRIVLGDAALPETVDEAIALAVAEWGRLDGLYHVAGGSGRRAGDGALHEVSDQGWDYTIRLNLTSQFYSNRAAVRQFLKQGAGGVVLNMGSVLGWSPSPKYFSTFAYAAAKSAILGMTRSAAACYAADNIRFNVVAPGLVETPMARRAVDDPKIMWFAKHKQPLDGGRMGQPGDLDGAVVYLLSDASRFVTGQVLGIDGGWDVTEGQYPE